MSSTRVDRFNALKSMRLQALKDGKSSSTGKKGQSTSRVATGSAEESADTPAQEIDVRKAQLEYSLEDHERYLTS